MVSYAVLGIAATGAMAFGLAAGFFLAFRMMDARVQQAREERDRALDMQRILDHRAPVMAVVRKEMAEQEEKERLSMRDGGSRFGEMFQDEVGDEPVDERAIRTPPGVDRAVLEG